MWSIEQPVDFDYKVVAFARINNFTHQFEHLICSLSMHFYQMKGQ